MKPDRPPSPLAQAARGRDAVDRTRRLGALDAICGGAISCGAATVVARGWLEGISPTTGQLAGGGLALLLGCWLAAEGTAMQRASTRRETAGVARAIGRATAAAAIAALAPISLFLVICFLAFGDGATIDDWMVALVFLCGVALVFLPVLLVLMHLPVLRAFPSAVAEAGDLAAARAPLPRGPSPAR